MIEGLEETKRIATDIGQKAELARITQANIRITSEKYRPVANRSSLLFFLMNDLVKIHTYYIYSLAAFTLVFYRGIDLVPIEVGKVDRYPTMMMMDDDACIIQAAKAEGEGADGEAAGGEGKKSELNDEELAKR